MDNSAQNEQPATPKRQSVRRRLVQSTLFPLKPPEREENNGDHKAERDNDEEEDDEDCSGSQSKRKRNSKGRKTTTPKKAPKKNGKRSANSTPKENGTDVEGADVAPVIPDLRLEARMTAEENSRIFSGKQIHPFFSSWKVCKKNREVTEVEGSSSFFGNKDKGFTCRPIHVFDKTQEDAAFVDWRNWTVCEDTFLKSGSDLECMSSSSIFEGSTECLNFDKLPIVFQPCKSSIFQNAVSLDQCHIQQERAFEASSTVPESLADEQVMSYQHSKETEDHEAVKVGLFSEHTGYIKKSDIEQQSIYLEERVMATCPGCGNEPGDSLWTYKYRPKKAVEVCGNDESVKFLSEWLRFWYARDSQTSEDPTGSGNCDRQDNDYRCSQSDSDLESEDEDARMKKNNVLLVTGPIGSGKSAAIYACAQEQGFKVLELNASECRNGALVKHRFGEALESRHLRRSVANPVGSQNKLIVKSPFVEVNSMTDQEFDDEFVELIPISDEDFHDATGTSVKSDFKEDQSKIKHLILFEDVDITFLEDRGFIAAVQQIAKTAKGPIILTSNSQNPALPDNFDRLKVHFILPSSKELQSHAYMVCAAEGANIEPYLLERFIECCRGDIRKIIMHLQFWCQGRSFRKDTKIRETYGSLQFDVDAGHLMLPKILPWDIPSQLSDLVEKEITKSLSMMEESSSSMEVVEEKVDNTEVQYSLDMPHNEMESIEAKKVAMLRRNGSFHDCNEYTAQIDTASKCSNDSGVPFSSCRRNVRRMHDVVMSSDSEDEFINNGCTTVTDEDTNNEVLGEEPLSEKLFCSVVADIDGHYQCSQTADEMHMNDTCNSVDVSCVPESSYVPETEFDNGTELSSQTVSSGHVVDPIKEVFLCKELPVEPNNLDKFKSELPGNSDKLGHNDAIAEYSHQELEDSQNEHVETVPRAYQVMDEASRMDFNKGSNFMKGQKSYVVTDLVQESWNKLRGSRSDLRQYVASEQQDACQIVMLAHKMSNLISETDILFSKCQPLMRDSLEPSMIPLEESNAYSCYDVRLLLASTTAQHGFCFYAKGISSIASNVGCVRRVDLASEMLANTTNMMALGKLIGPGTGTNMTSYAGRNSEMTVPNVLTSEINSRVFDIIQSIVPSRMYLALKCDAFHDYLSALCHISRSEAFRLSKGVEKTTRRRRRRVAPHYLSSGALMLSPEHISLLDQYNLYGKTSSSHQPDAVSYSLVQLRCTAAPEKPAKHHPMEA